MAQVRRKTRSASRFLLSNTWSSQTKFEDRDVKTQEVIHPNNMKRMTSMKSDSCWNVLLVEKKMCATRSMALREKHRFFSLNGQLLSFCFVDIRISHESKSIFISFRRLSIDVASRKCTFRVRRGISIAIASIMGMWWQHHDAWQGIVSSHRGSRWSIIFRTVIQLSSVDFTVWSEVIEGDDDLQVADAANNLA